MFEAMRVYVVVVDGLTETDVPVTVPMFVIPKLVAPVTFHESVLEPPKEMELGEAVKLLIVGTELPA